MRFLLGNTIAENFQDSTNSNFGPVVDTLGQSAQLTKNIVDDTVNYLTIADEQGYLAAFTKEDQKKFRDMLATLGAGKLVPPEERQKYARLIASIIDAQKADAQKTTRALAQVLSTPAGMELRATLGLGHNRFATLFGTKSDAVLASTPEKLQENFEKRGIAALPADAGKLRLTAATIVLNDVGLNVPGFTKKNIDGIYGRTRIVDRLGDVTTLAQTVGDLAPKSVDVTYADLAAQSKRLLAMRETVASRYGLPIRQTETTLQAFMEAGRKAVHDDVPKAAQATKTLLAAVRKSGVQVASAQETEQRVRTLATEHASTLSAVDVAVTAESAVLLQTAETLASQAPVQLQTITDDKALAEAQLEWVRQKLSSDPQVETMLALADQSGHQEHRERVSQLLLELQSLQKRKSLPEDSAQSATAVLQRAVMELDALQATVQNRNFASRLAAFFRGLF